MPEVVVDWSPDSPSSYESGGWAVVVVDVIRASTTAVTAVSSGHRCYPVRSVEEAHRIAGLLDHPVLAGELEGAMPEGFHMQNSPTAVSTLGAQGDLRPVVLLSSSGTRLMVNARACEIAYVACLRNVSAQVDHLAQQRARRVAVLGAGSSGVFREEDQICCSSIAAGLIERGYVAGASTRALVEQWRGTRADGFMNSGSVDYLRRTGQTVDLDFIVSHLDDLDQAFVMQGNEIVDASSPTPRAAASG